MAHNTAAWILDSLRGAERKARVRADTCEAIPRSRVIFKNKYLKKSDVSGISVSLQNTQSCTLSHMDSQKWRTAPSSEISGGRSGECSDEHQSNKDLQTVRKVFGGTFKSYAVKIKDQIRYEKTENSTRWKDFEWQPRDEAAFLFRINGGCHWGHVLKWRKGNEF